MIRNFIDIVEGIDPKSRYRTGSCDAFAIAMHHMTDWPLAVWRGWFDDDLGNDGDRAFEDVHMVVIAPNGRWVDVDGFHQGEPSNLYFENPVDEVTLTPLTEQEAEYVFFPAPTQDEIDEAVLFIKHDNVLRKIAESTLKESVIVFPPPYWPDFSQHHSEQVGELREFPVFTKQIDHDLTAYCVGDPMIAYAIIRRNSEQWKQLVELNTHEDHRGDGLGASLIKWLVDNIGRMLMDVDLSEPMVWTIEKLVRNKTLTAHIANLEQGVLEPYSNSQDSSRPLYDKSVRGIDRPNLTPEKASKVTWVLEHWRPSRKKPLMPFF